MLQRYETKITSINANKVNKYVGTVKWTRNQTIKEGIID